MSLGRRINRRVQRRRKRVEKRAARSRQLRQDRTRGGLLGTLVGSTILGLGLIMVGFWFMIDQFWFALPGIGQLWPLILMVVGAGNLFGYVLSGFRRYQYVVSAVTCSLLGLFFLAFTLGSTHWGALALLWPTFPLISGVASMLGWLASFGRELRLLQGGVVSFLIGVVGFGFTLAFFGVGPFAGGFSLPFVLILAGGAVLMVQVARVLIGVLPRLVSRLI